METLAYVHHADSYENTTRQPSPFKTKKAVKKAAGTRTPSTSPAPTASALEMQGWVMPWMP